MSIGYTGDPYDDNYVTPDGKAPSTDSGTDGGTPADTGVIGDLEGLVVNAWDATGGRLAGDVEAVGQAVVGEMGANRSAASNVASEAIDAAKNAASDSASAGAAALGGAVKASVLGAEAAILTWGTIIVVVALAALIAYRKGYL